MSKTENSTPGGESAADPIESILTEPKRVSGDAGSVERYSAYEQIAVDKYLASKNTPRTGFSLPLTKFEPGGTL